MFPEIFAAENQESAEMAVRFIVTFFVGILLISPAVFAQEGGGEPDCKEKITRVGRPNMMQTVAGLSAVKAWAEAAKEIGVDYMSWHKAKQPTVDCKKNDGSRYYICYASAKPCSDKKAQTANK